MPTQLEVAARVDLYSCTRRVLKAPAMCKRTEELGALKHIMAVILIIMAAVAEEVVLRLLCMQYQLREFRRIQFLIL